MATITPFKALRPQAQQAKAVASRPYDVLSTKEAKVEAQGNPSSFLHITRSEIDLPENTDPYCAAVYAKAKENLDAFISRDILFRENKECYYIYQLVMNGKTQTGLVCGSSLEDYDNNIIKKHEFTRPEKELDRINHIKTTGAQTGNVFLAYKSNADMDKIVEDWKRERSAVYDFTADDNIKHTIWIVNDATVISKITSIFAEQIPFTYIADGHHRAASAAKVRELMGWSKGTDFFLTTLFPSDQLHIMDYNRVIKDLNGESAESFLEKLNDSFNIEKAEKAFSPDAPLVFGMYVPGQWYKLTAKEGTYQNDPIGILDISVLQNLLLGPVLGIHDQRTDKRIDFVGGIRGISALEERVDSGEMALAFSLHPVTINQLFAVADSGNVMPPKSTWFEPKLRDGLLTYMLDQ